MVFIEDTHKAGGGALVVHHGKIESGKLHVGQAVMLLSNISQLVRFLITSNRLAACIDC